MRSGPVSRDTENERAAIQHILQSYLYLFSQQRWDEWIDLWADDGVLEFPFTPAERRRRYVGTTDILDYMKPMSGRIKVKELELLPACTMLGSRDAHRPKGRQRPHPGNRCPVQPEVHFDH